MIKVEYCPIRGCVGWVFRSPTEEVERENLGLKISSIKCRPCKYKKLFLSKQNKIKLWTS